MVAVILVASLGVGVWWQRGVFQAKPQLQLQTLAIRTAKVRKGGIVQKVRVPGVTSAGNFATLMAPQMRGYRGHGHDFDLNLLSIVSAGERVKKGQVVARFDPLYMQNRLLDYDAMVRQSETNLRSLLALLEVRRQGYRQLVLRYKGRMEKAELDTRRAPVLSAMKIERNRLTYEQFAAEYKEIAAEANFVDIGELALIRRYELALQLAKMERDRARANLIKMEPKAELSGIVVKQTITQGSTTRQLQDGDQVSSGQPYLKIMDTSQMVVDARLNQVDAERLRIGMAAQVQLDAYPDIRLKAHVTSVGAFAGGRGWRAAWVKYIPVRLKLEQSDSRVLPDLSVSADILVNQSDEVTVVPRECVFEQNGQQFAMVRVGDEWSRRTVEAGMADNLNVEIRSGLNPGDIVAAEPVAVP